MANPGGKTNDAGGRKRKSRLVAALLAVFLGFLGVHKFYLRQIKAGLIQLFGFLVLLVAATATGIGWLYHAVFFAAVAFGIAEGVLYTRLTDEEFDRVHVEGRRALPCLERRFTLNSWKDVLVYVLAAMMLFFWANMVFGSASGNEPEAAEEAAVVEEADEEETEEDVSEEDGVLSEAEELAAEKETEDREVAASDEDGSDTGEAGEQGSDDTEEETEAGDGTVSGTSYTRAGTSTVSYTIDNRYLAGDIEIEFVEATEDGVVVTVTTDEDRAFLDIYLISVDGSTYRGSDFYSDTDDYSFGVFLWSDGEQEWGDYYPSITVEEGEVLVLMLSCFDDVEFDEMTIYCDYTVYILNGSGAVTSSFEFEGCTVTLTKD